MPPDPSEQGRQKQIPSDAEEEPLHTQTGDPALAWMDLEPSLNPGVSPPIAALVEELNAEYPLTTAQGHPCGHA